MKRGLSNYKRIELKNQDTEVSVFQQMVFQYFFKQLSLVAAKLRCVFSIAVKVKSQRLIPEKSVKDMRLGCLRDRKIF